MESRNRQSGRRITRSVLFVCWLVLTLVPVSGFLTSELASGHSATFHAPRIMGVAAAWSEGLIVPRWCPILATGLGYPIFNYYGWFPYGLGAIPYLMGLAPVAAANAVYVLSGLLLGAGAWFLGREFGGRKGALVTWALFTYAPYQFVNLYVRASLSEYFAGALAPWALWGIILTVRRAGRAGPLIATTALSLMIISHNITAFVFGPLVSVFALGLILAGSRLNRPVAIRRVASVLVLAVVTSAHFWMPLIAGIRDVQISRVYQAEYSYSIHFLYLHQFFARTWGFGSSCAGLPDGMSFQLGIGLLVVLLLAALMAADPHAGMKRAGRLVMGIMSGVLILCFLMTYYSAWVWKAIPPLALIQFPWRLLLPASLMVALGASILCVYYPSRMTRFRGGRFQIVMAKHGPLLVAAIAIATSLPYCGPDRYSPSSRDALVKELREDYITTTVVNEYEPTAGGDPKGNLKPLLGLSHILIDGEPSTIPCPNAHLRLSASLDLDHPARVSFPTFYFPGWHVTDGGVEVAALAFPATGLLSTDLPAGHHVLVAQWHPTGVQTASAVISVLGWLTLVGWLWSIKPTKRVPRQPSEKLFTDHPVLTGSASAHQAQQ